MKLSSSRFSSIYAYLVITFIVLIQFTAGQAQEGNQDITGNTEDDGTSIQNGYFSYVSEMNEMDSAASVREAMETLSWASKGSSWMIQSAEATSEEAQVVQATPSSSEALQATQPAETPVAVTPTPAAIVSTEPKSTSSSSSSSNTLAIGLGVGIPLAVLSILSVVGIAVYKKRKSTRKDFEKRTANLRQMSETQV